MSSRGAMHSRSVHQQSVSFDTIGVGDAFMARWRARGLGREGLTHLDEVADAVGFACRVAALTCARPGADASDLGVLEQDDREGADATSLRPSRV